MAEETTFAFLQSSMGENVTNASLNDVIITTLAPAPPMFPPRKSGLITADVATDVSEAVYCYILPILVIFGAAGNLMSIAVLLVEKKKDTTNMSLTALAISDTGYILTTFVRQTSCILSKFDVVKARNYTTLMYGQMIVINICFSRITSLITAIISTERCLAVTLPLQVRSIVTKGRMAVTLVLAYLVSFALIGPVFFMGESYWVTNPRTNTSYVTYAYTDWYINNKEFADAYRDIFLNAVFRFLPVGLVCFNTIAIILRLKKASSWRGDSSSSQARTVKEKKLTNMLLTLCGIYLFCTLPGLIFQCFTFATDEFSVFGRYKNMYKMATSISILTQFINSSINFVVYMAMNERFAKTYVELFGCKGVCGKSIEDTSLKSGKSKTTMTKLTNTTSGVNSTDGTISSTNNAEPQDVQVAVIAS